MMRWCVGLMQIPVRRWLMLAVCSLMAGCGGPSGPVKVTVTGKITLDGKPVPNGQVIFSDAAGVVAADSGDIKNGQFSFRSTLGSKKVSISSMQASADKKAAVGGIPGDPVSEKNPATVYEDIIPEKYNSKTELKVDVTQKGPNDFPLTLTTK